MLLKIVGSFVLVCLLATIASGQVQQPQPSLDKPFLESYSFDFTGGGARAEGMGNAFLGVSDDNSAASWNPAGIYDIEKPILSLSYGSLAPRGYTTTFITVDNNNKYDHIGSLKRISFASFVAPVRIKGHQFVGSFSYTRNFNDYQAYTSSDSAWQIRTLTIEIEGRPQTFTDSIAYKSNVTAILEGGLESINLGVGTRIYNNISAGAALNIYTGHAIRDNNTINDADSMTNSFLDPQIVHTITTTEVLDSNIFSGFNVTLGMKISGEKWNAGLVIHSPYSLNVTTGRSIYIITQKNGLEVNEGTDTVYYDDLLAKYDVPLIIGAGVGYQAKENLLLAADAEYRAFGGSKVKVRDSLFLDPGGVNKEFFTEIDPEWNNVFTMRLGMEYMKETSFGKVPLRAGFGYTQLPFANIDENDNRSTPSKVSLSLGTGIWWSQIHLDWAYTYSSYTWDVAGKFEQKNKDHHFNFSFTGYF